jgi:hypothetical protein
MSNPTPTDERVITGPQAIQLVKAAVAERGTAYNYKTDTARFPNSNPALWKECMYVRNGEPDCLIGVSLVRYGVPVQALQEVENAKGMSNVCDHEDDEDCAEGMCGESSVSSPWFQSLLAQHSQVRLSPEAVLVFHAAQRYQDAGRSWGEAEKAAEQALVTGVLTPFPNEIS